MALTWSDITGLFKDSGGNVDWSKILLGGAGVAGLAGLLGNDQVQKFLGIGGANTNQPVGYTGGIPKYTATRTQLPDPNRDLQMGQIREYGAQFGLENEIAANAQKALDSGVGFEQLLKYTAQQGHPYTPKNAMPLRRPGAEGRRYFTDLQYTPAPVAAAQGGLMSLPESRGYYLGGPTDGMADRIPARIDDKQEARLSDGEFVIDAGTVSALGNGNSSAGAQVLYDMMERVRQAAHGKKEQQNQINPRKVLPA